MGMMAMGAWMAYFVCFLLPSFCGLIAIFILARKTLIFWMMVLVFGFGMSLFRMAAVFYSYQDAGAVPVWTAFFSLLLGKLLWLSWIPIAVVILGMISMKLLKKQSDLLPGVLGGMLLSFIIQFIAAHTAFKTFAQLFGERLTY